MRGCGWVTLTLAETAQYHCQHLGLHVWHHCLIDGCWSATMSHTPSSCQLHHRHLSRSCCTAGRSGVFTITTSIVCMPPVHGRQMLETCAGGSYLLVVTLMMVVEYTRSTHSQCVLPASILPLSLCCSKGRNLRRPVTADTGPGPESVQYVTVHSQEAPCFPRSVIHNLSRHRGRGSWCCD